MDYYLGEFQNHISSKIFYFRGNYVIIDSDLAEIYGVQTNRLNEQVKRNFERFPVDFMFQLSSEEWSILMSQNAISRNHGGRRKLPYVFTEQGVAGLSGVLKSEQASIIHVAIMRAFVTMRHNILTQSGMIQRIDLLERKQLLTEHQFEQILIEFEKNTMSSNLSNNDGRVFFNGQVFDAYEFVSRIIRSAKVEITLIDNYIDESTFIHLTKKAPGVQVCILSKKISEKVALDCKKANEQYGGFLIKSFSLSHDRFLIIDKKEIYHIGASLKDLGKLWFALTQLDSQTVASVLKELEKV
jgi:hypothetical protein